MDDTIQERQYLQSAIEEDLKVLGPCPEYLRQDDIEIPQPDGTTHRAIIVRPSSTNTTETRKCPLIVFIHGGGFSYGSPEFVLSPARGFASLLDAVVVCPSYKYSPENLFPASATSAWDIVAWLSNPENLNHGILKGEHVKVDLSKGFVVGGSSSGGNLAAVIAAMSALTATDKTSGLTAGRAPMAHPLTGVFLSVPMLVHEAIIPDEYKPMFTSRVENEFSHLTNAASLRDTVRRGQIDVRSPWFSALNMDLSKLAGHHAPKVFIQGGSGDVLRDDGPVYAKALEDNKIAEARVEIVQGVEHIGWVSVPHPDTHTDDIRKVTLDGMAWLLNTKWNKAGELPY